MVIFFAVIAFAVNFVFLVDGGEIIFLKAEKPKCLYSILPFFCLIVIYVRVG